MTEDNVVTVRIVDNRKLKKKDERSLGVTNFMVGDIIELQRGSG